MDEKEIAAKIRSAVHELNTALGAAKKAGLRVDWSVDGEECSVHNSVSIEGITKVTSY